MHPGRHPLDALETLLQQSRDLGIVAAVGEKHAGAAVVDGGSLGGRQRARQTVDRRVLRLIEALDDHRDLR